MNGTKMSLKRYGDEIAYFDYQEIIVNEDYLTIHNDLLVHLDYAYVPGFNMLEVHYNGHLLTVGEGYEEVDYQTIRLNVTDSEGNSLNQFMVGDEIVIKVWRNNYIAGEGLRLYTQRFTALESELLKARNEHPDLDSRLDIMQANLKRVIVFVIPGGRAIQTGVQKIEICFPFSGKIVDVYASNRVAGTTRTVIAIEKISQEDFDNDNPEGWLNVFSGNLIIDPNEKSSRTSSAPFVIENLQVAANDHFRVRIDELGDGVEDITVEVTVEV